MAVNLVSLAMQFLTPSVVGKLASSIGLDQSTTQKATGAAIPAILAGLAGVASKPEGAQPLANAITKQDSGVLGNFTSILGGAGQSSLVSSGVAALNSLLGSSAVSALAGALGKFSGASESPAKSLLGLLGPVVLGLLGQQQKASGLDAKGLAGLLVSQKENIAAAMPTGFSSLLAGTNLLSSISGNLKSGAAAVTSAAAAKPATASVKSPATVSTASVGAAARPGTVPPRPVARHSSLWLLALAALTGLLAWNWFSERSRQAVMAPPAPSMPMPATKIMVGSTDVGAQLTAVMDGISAALGGVKDAATAQTALPKLNDAAAQLDKIQAMQIPADGRKALAALVETGMKSLDPLFASVMALPAVGPVVKPAIDLLKARLAALAKA